MDVREKLVEILRKPIFPHELVDPIEAVADYLLDSGVTVQEWISVDKNEHSYTGNRLIALADGLVTVGYQSGYGVWVYWRNGIKHQTYEVTHWMPLPQPPKGE